MHLFLTDRITCPRCGPQFGLILLAHDVRDWRVLEGDLGCSNCREKYPVKNGFGDLRIPPRAALPAPSIEPDSSSVTPEEVLEIAAFLGVTEGPGTLLIKGPAVRFAAGLVELIGGVEVVAMGPGFIEGEESKGVSRMAAGHKIPFSSGTFRGILLSGEVTALDFEEAVRAVGPSGRIVVLDAGSEAEGWVGPHGAKVLLQEGSVLITQRVQTEALPLVTLRGL